MDETEDAVRLFLGVQVSMKIVDELAEMTRSMAPLAQRSKLELRWVSPANYHVTVQYLGWTREPVIIALGDALADVATGVAPFAFEVKGTGAFPSASRASVVWAGIGRGADDIESLAKAVQKVTEPLGFAPEPRPFHPHVTLGRFGKATNAEPLLLPFSTQRVGLTKVKSLVLWESKMSAKGARYERRGQWQLSKPAV